MLKEEALTNEVLAAAIEVHRHRGPGLLESCYEQCLCHELTLRGIAFQRQVDCPVEYKGLKLDCGFRIDILVNGEVILEPKSVDKFHPVHDAQLITCMKLANKKVGILLNFNARLLKDGIMRRVL